MRNFTLGKYLIPIWLVSIVLISGIVVGAYYVWRTITIPAEVKEPLELLYYPFELSLYPGENKEFNITVQIMPQLIIL